MSGMCQHDFPRADVRGRSRGFEAPWTELGLEDRLSRMRVHESMMSELTNIVQDWQDVRKASSLIYVSGPLLTCLVERSTFKDTH